MNTIFRLFVICFLLLTFISCDSNEVNSPDVNTRTIIDTKLYNELSGADVIDAEILGDKLKVTIGASGCDGSTWEARLISSGGVIKTNPPKREMKIEFINKELCAAVLTKVFVFDLKPLRWNDTKKIEIVLISDKGAKSLLYEY